MKSIRPVVVGVACLCLLASDALARGGRKGRSGGRTPATHGSHSFSPPSRSGGHASSTRGPSLPKAGLSKSSLPGVGHPGSLSTPHLGTPGRKPNVHRGTTGLGQHPTRNQLGNFLSPHNGAGPRGAGVLGTLDRSHVGTLTNHAAASQIRDRWQSRSAENRPFDGNWWDQHAAAVAQLPAWHCWNNPAWAHPGQPYYWWSGATAAAVTSWVAYGWAQPTYYNYGDNVYYEDETVYVDGAPVATAQQYYQEAADIVAATPESGQAAATEIEWMPLGVFAVAEQDAATSGTLIQLAVSKEGALSGTYFQRLSGATRPLKGAVDKDSQRAAWTFADGRNTDVVMETGVFNLTKDQCQMLVHHDANETDTYVLVRLSTPQQNSTTSPTIP